MIAGVTEKEQLSFPRTRVHNALVVADNAILLFSILTNSAYETVLPVP